MAEPRYVPTDADRDVTRQRLDDEALLRTARTRFQRSDEAEDETRRQMLIDQAFLAGDQWDLEVRRVREQPGQNRPCFVLNLMKPALKQVTNEQRASRPALRVSPTGNGASVEVAKICDGLLRAIQRESRAMIAYDTASADAASMGRGWFRILTEYESPESFAQRLAITSIPNALSVYPQPNCQQPDYSDMDWCFIAQDMPHDEFLARFPGMQPTDFDAWKGTGDTDGWLTTDTVRVVEYYWRELEEHRLVLLSDGTTIDLERGTRQELEARLMPLGLTIVDERTAQVPCVYWAQLCGRQVLERTKLLGSWIPVIPVLGDRIYIGTRVHLAGLLRDARDAQRMVNYWASAEAEAVALAPRAPWLMVEGQDEGYMQEWANANTQNQAVLHWKMVSVNGQFAPPPQRNVQEPAIQAIMASRVMAMQDFQRVTAIFDASYGAPSNETSGRAIQVRDKNSDMGNRHYQDNFAQYSLYHAGRIMLELLPKVYSDPGRVLQIVQEDETDKRVIINQPHTEDDTGLEKFYDLTTGSYSVAVNAGPSYTTQRQESMDFMLNLAKIDPKITQVADDMLVSLSDAPIAQDLSKRLKKTIPPQLLDDGQGADKDTQLAIAQGQAQKAQQEAQALNAHAQQVEQALQQAQQQLSTLAQENAALKADRGLAARELDLKSREQAHDAAVDERKLELEEQEQVLAAHKLALEAQAHAVDTQLKLTNGASNGSQRAAVEARLRQLEAMMQQLLALERAEQRREDGGG